MKRIILALAILSLVGCATEAVMPSKAKDAPQSRLLNYQNTTDDANSTLIVVRDKGYLGSGCDLGVYLNDKKSAILKPGEKATFHLHPGEWSVAMKGEGSFCITDATPVGSYVNLAKDEKKAVRLFADPSGNVDVKPLPMN